MVAMRQFFFLAALIWLASWPALAQVPTTGAGKGAPSSGGPTYTPTAGVCQVGGFATTVTFSSVAIGTGLVVVADEDDGKTSRTGETVTINGNAATQITSINQAGAAVYYASNTGSSGNIVITNSNGLDVVCIQVGYLANLSSSTPTASIGVTYANTQNQPYALGSSLTVNSGGFGLYFFGAISSQADGPPTWSSATADSITVASNASGNGMLGGGAHSTASANPGASCTTACNFAYVTLLAAAWR